MVFSHHFFITNGQDLCESSVFFFGGEGLKGLQRGNLDTFLDNSPFCYEYTGVKEKNQN